MKLTNKEFCARLRKAKKLAVRSGYCLWAISDACASANLALGRVAIFDEGGPYENWLSGWVYHETTSLDDIGAMFDNSIRDLGEEP